MASLTDWIPALAAKHGTVEVPMHMLAQRIAGELGISWSKEMPANDIDRICAAVDARYAAR